MTGERASDRPTRPRVLLASRVYRPEPGAAPLRLGALVDALAGDADVHVLTTRPRRGAGAVPDGRTRVSRWPVLRDRHGAVRGYLPYASFDVPLALRLLLARRPDVVVVEPPPTTGAVVRAVCALRRTPYVYYAADVLSLAVAATRAPVVVRRAVRALESWAMRGATTVVTVTEEVAEALRGLGVDPGRVRVVGTGVDVRRFRPGAGEGGGTADHEPPADEPVDDAGPRLVYAGTMSEVHGAGVFVEAFARVADRFPTARLLMHGQGTDVAALRRRAEELVPGRVELTGLLPVDDVARSLGRARAALASVRPGAGYDLAVATKAFAATACGTPVLYAGAGPGARLVRENDLGWAVAWEVGAVAEAMGRALAAPPSPGRREALARWTRTSMSAEAVAAVAAGTVLECRPRVPAGRGPAAGRSA